MKVISMLFRIVLLPMFLVAWIMWYVGFYDNWKSFDYSFTDGIKDWITGK